MPQPPELTFETFRVLAAQAGIDTTDSHLREIFPDVQLMLTRAAQLARVDVTGAEPPPFDAGAGWDTTLDAEGE